MRKKFVRRTSNCLAMARTHAPASNLMKTRGGAPRDFLKLLPCQNIFDPIHGYRLSHPICRYPNRLNTMNNIRLFFISLFLGAATSLLAGVEAVPHAPPTPAEAHQLQLFDSNMHYTFRRN